MVQAVRSAAYRYRSHYTVAMVASIILALAGGVVAPNVIAPDNSATSVTVTTIRPNIDKCFLKSTGRDNNIDLEANSSLPGFQGDVNRTNTQVMVNRVNQTDPGVTGQNTSLYFLVNLSISTGDNGAGGIDDLVNITIEAWWEDQATAADETQFGYTTSNTSNPGKNNRFRLEYTTGSKGMGGPTNASTVLWPVGTTEGGQPEVRVNHLGIPGNVVRRTGTTQTEVAIPVELGPNIRWSRNASLGTNNSDVAGLDDRDSWNFRCIAQMDADPGVGFQAGVFNDPVADTLDLWEFSTWKYSSFTLSGTAPSGAFAPGGPERPFPCTTSATCTTIDYKSNAPFNLSINISNLGQTVVDCPASSTCIDADDIGIDVGQMAGTAGSQGSACTTAPGTCYRFDWDNVSGRTNDGFLWIRGANGTGAFRQDATSRWHNITCGSEEIATLAATTCTNAEDPSTSWYAQIAAGVLEGSYSAKITYKLRMHLNPSPRSQSET